MIWYWIQEFDPKYVYPNKKKNSRITAAFIIDETQIHIGSNEAWLWVAVIEPIHRTILGVYISRHRNIIVVAESFLRSLVKLYGKHIVYSDGGTWYPNRSMYIDRMKTQATSIVSKEHYRKNYGVCKG
jgi:transposase-like protein